MTRYAVFIGTTAGPARIERITLEPSARASMVCLGRSARQLPLSADYDSFVAPGIGAAARAFGPFSDGGFRMDLSAPVSGGDSWQLAVFVAHAIAADPDASLARDLDDADSVLWLSGSVDYDYQAHPVAHMAEKLHASSPAFAEWLRAGRPVTVIVPVGANLESATAGVPSAVRCLGVSTAFDACSAVGLSGGTARESPAPGGGKPSRILMWTGVAVVCLLLAGLLAWLGTGRPPVGEWPVSLAAMAPDTAEDATAPVRQPPPGAVAPSTPPTDLSLEVVGGRAPPDQACKGVLFGDGDTVAVPLVGTIEGLCTLEITVRSRGERRFVAARLVSLRGNLLAMDGEPLPVALDGTFATSGSWRWRYEFPQSDAHVHEFVVMAVAGQTAVDADLARLVEAAGAAEAVDAVRQAGRTVIIRRFLLEP